MFPSWSSHNRLPGLILGLSIPLIVCALFARGAFDSLEFPALDAHFRWFGRIPASENIVHIDITDQAIKLGSQPCHVTYFLKNKQPSQQWEVGQWGL